MIVRRNKRTNKSSEQLSRIAKKEEYFKINCSGATLKELALELGGTPYDRIGSIDVSNNLIKDIPASLLGKLHQLESLNASHNQIEKICFPYIEFRWLANLQVNHNKLDSINIEHIKKLTSLNCSNNAISLLTVPQSLRELDASCNSLKNIYFLEKCALIQTISIASNCLIDLKFTSGKRKIYQEKAQQYVHIRLINASGNQIQHLQEFRRIAAVEDINLSNNQIALNRQNINELLALKGTRSLNLIDNPLGDGGYELTEVRLMLIDKLPQLSLLNGVTLSTQDEQLSVEVGSYNIFMDSQRKETLRQKGEWNFTLGDCEEEQTLFKSVNDLSEIRLTEVDLNIHRSPLLKPTQRTPKGVADQHSVSKSVSIVLKERQANCYPHTYYGPFLSQLLEMSYVPRLPLRQGASNITTARLDQADDDFILIDRMFSNRGGVSYVKKIQQWTIDHKPATIGFIMNEISAQEWKAMRDSEQPISTSNRHVIGSQPNVFSCYHAIVRMEGGTVYPCVYLVESNQI